MTGEPHHAQPPHDAEGNPVPAQEVREVPEVGEAPEVREAPEVQEVPQASQVPQVPQHELVRTRTSGVWVAVGIFAILLLFLLIFILQNSHSVDVSYLGSHSRLGLGVALLLSAVCGVLLAVLAGTARILQLRTAARRHRRLDAKAAKAANKAAATVPPPGTSD